jgi:hypothetical protein
MPSSDTTFAGDPNRINRSGPPTLEQRAEREATLVTVRDKELRKVLSRLRLASPKALAILIESMEDESIPMASRIKYAKDIYDLYLKTIGMDISIKKAKATNAPAEEEEKQTIPAVVFKLHETKKTGTNK